jgi:hypothetical protein
LVPKFRRDLLDRDRREAAVLEQIQRDPLDASHRRETTAGSAIGDF